MNGTLWLPSPGFTVRLRYSKMMSFPEIIDVFPALVFTFLVNRSKLLMIFLEIRNHILFLFLSLIHPPKLLPYQYSRLTNHSLTSVVIFRGVAEPNLTNFALLVH